MKERKKQKKKERNKQTKTKTNKQGHKTTPTPAILQPARLGERQGMCRSRDGER
jgi:hypothetical protein